MDVPTLEDARVVVAVWLPTEGCSSHPSLTEHGLQHPADVQGFKSLSDGSCLGLVIPIQRVPLTSEAEELLECRKRVDCFLQSCGGKEARFLQKWPLHQSGKKTLFLHALAPKFQCHQRSEKCFWWQTAGRLPFLDRLHQTFGEAIAWSFAWQVTFSVCLCFMAFSSSIATAIKWSNAELYQSMMPVISFMVISWCMCMTENQACVMTRLQHHWEQLHHASQRRSAAIRTSEEMSELSSEISFSHARRISSKRQWKEVRSKCIACLRRNFRFQMCCAPILLLEWLFIWTFFLAFFWLQLWTTFEWGGCREYNERTGTRDCMSPEFLYPVWGKVLAAVPSFAQGFAFELVSGLSKLSVELIVKMQSWESQDEMRCTAATYYFFLEVVGKLGFICVLGFLYVPDYGGDEVGCSQRLDFWFLGNWSFSCLKLNVPRKLRLQLFLASVKGPFLISGLLGILKKTFLPILLEKLRSMETTNLLFQCIIRCSIACVRLLLLILYCDWHARDSGAAASLGALPRLGDGASLPWKEALKEGQRRPFAPLEESVELLLHFLWVSCFVVVYPLGGLLAFANQALELRCDTIKLLAARRRPWPRSVGSAEKDWVPSCARRIVHIAIVMNVLVLLLPFALASSDCGAVLIIKNPCTLTTIFTAMVSIVAFEIYWCFLSWLLRSACFWQAEITGDFTPDILPNTTLRPAVPMVVSREHKDRMPNCCERWFQWM